MKKNKFLAVILAMAVAVGAAGVTTYAVGKDANDTEAPSTVATAASASDTEAVKDETVYVMTAADGSTQKILVSDWIKNALPAEAQKAIESLNDAQQVKDDCWTGTIQKELPVSMSIHYTLDGKTVTPSQLAGKSGKVTIRFEYENNQYEVRTVNGVSQKVYVPFVALTGALLDTSHFSNVTVSNGKLINDGDRIAVMGMAFPGLQEDLGISKEQLDLPDYVEISADVTDFTLETTLTVVSNSLLNEVDTDDLTSGDLGSLSDSLGKLTDAMDQLMDGSSQLYDGLCTLLDSCGQLSDGVDQLTDGLDQLSSNSSALNAGAKQVFTSLLAMADEQLQPQLAQAGIPVTRDREQAEVLLCGFDTELTFQKLEDACILLNRGVPFIATNPDWVCPTWYGSVPDCGSVCEMLFRATGQRPYVIGKPRPDMARLAMARGGFSAEETVLLGDRLYTDIACAVNAGIDSVFVLSGEGTRDDIERDGIRPTWVYDDINAVFRAWEETP